MTTRIRAVLCLFALVFAAALARADAEPVLAVAPSTSAEEVLPAIPSRQGVAVATLGFELGILPARQRVRGQPALGPGFALEVVTRPSSWPLMIGLGGGLLSFDEHDRQGPTVQVRDTFGIGSLVPTTLVRSAELRHAELLLRYQPLWGWLRPFAEGALGLAALWTTETLFGRGTDVVAAHERERSVGLLYGGTLGLDLKLWTLDRSAEGSFDLMLTAGTKCLSTSPMRRPAYGSAANQELRASAARSAFLTWVPFLALSLAIDTRPAR
ncbi:MAG: hypothetical protein JWN48_1747 [Myxococcaceae bacterium]|nr:hypothetical protein [Myxococcaceae bacterium]